MDQSAQPSLPTRSFKLLALHEYRFELDPAESISIRLVQGTAELFGFELAVGHDYPFGDEARAAIFSWHGADLEMSKVSTEYIAEETPVPTHLALHLALERMRLAAVAPKHFVPRVELPPSLRTLEELNEDGDDERLGPRVMVVGGLSSGKSTLVKTLANLAIRSGRTKVEGPGLLLGAFTLPGTFSIAPLYASIPTTTSVHPFGSTPTTGLPVLFTPANPFDAPLHPTPNPALFAPPLNALSFYYGHADFGRNLGLVDALFRRMGSALDARIEKGAETAAWTGGLIVDTPGEFCDKNRGAIVKEAVRSFGINVIVVMGTEKLQLEMSKLMSTNKTVRVVRVPKSSGASEFDLLYQRRLQSSQIRSYFYGGPALSQGQLSPFTIVVKFEDLMIYRVGEDALVPSSALPIGAIRTLKSTSLLRIDPDEPRTGSLLHMVLAIPQSEWDGIDPETDEATEAATGPVLGFVHLAGMDLVKRKYTILSPLPGRLPRKAAIAGSLEWTDS
ncbi:uncharacterized protein MELLADRAFT_88142 [Melampsora larici-populina 98AG31]|uniref:Polynucleotide 5'-hydroxyl-kinase GRC3 n=1 Tax=Melampsora larici-populina (strain 98AG31 / pathotype 3-4-7) TaxID=747676 RepID=F4RQQ4_MELLP|nr:uncharacterized protein MELLADRAFT_88142 [Melampsora larici-populina 98AG31]EGG05280.1 hypothetical protein MELLADRAFT_88142 [Melampsora larici-populina 98AG31]